MLSKFIYTATAFFIVFAAQASGTPISSYSSGLNGFTDDSADPGVSNNIEAGNIPVSGVKNRLGRLP
ncbi:unnamed protein product [Mucor hiemalis]